MCDRKKINYIHPKAFKSENQTKRSKAEHWYDKDDNIHKYLYKFLSQDSHRKLWTRCKEISKVRFNHRVDSPLYINKFGFGALCTNVACRDY